MVQTLARERPLDRPSKGDQTRDRSMDIAERSILEKGFAATSIDEVIFEARITKSGFFYHFKDKNDLALALIQRFQAHDRAFHRSLLARAEELNEDPLHALLIALKLMAEQLIEMKTLNPGCLVTTFVLQDAFFDARVRECATEIGLEWRDFYLAQLERIAEVYPPKIDIDLRVLADMVTTVVDGGIVLAKSTRSPEAVGEQLLAYRSFVRAVFLGA